MITLLKCLGLIIGGLFVSRILLGLIEAQNEKRRKAQDEYQKLLDIKRKAEYEEMLKESERLAELEEKYQKIVSDIEDKNSNSGNNTGNNTGTNTNNENNNTNTENNNFILFLLMDILLIHTVIL